MIKFFNANSIAAADNLSFLERMIPLIVIYTVIALIILYGKKIHGTKMNIIIQSLLGISVSILFIVNSILLWLEEGIHISNLPLHLSSVCVVLSVVLLINKNKTIFNFILFIGLFNSLLSILTQKIEYSYQDYEYYYFIFMNGLVTLIPVYLLIVYQFIPTLKSLMKAFGALQVIGLVILIFNAIFDTTYMFLSSRATNSPITFLDWPWSLLLLDGTFLLVSLIVYTIIYYSNKAPRVRDYTVNTKSSYITKKKEPTFTTVKK